MCIRDRGDDGLVILGADDSQGNDFPSRAARKLAGDADPAVCLLYTSDAADDLLCVDLGGRRLIKKKTKTQHCKQSTARTHHFATTYSSTH